MTYAALQHIPSNFSLFSNKSWLEVTNKSYFEGFLRPWLTEKLNTKDK